MGKVSRMPRINTPFNKWSMRSFFSSLLAPKLQPPWWLDLYTPLLTGLNYSPKPNSRSELLSWAPLTSSTSTRKNWRNANTLITWSNRLSEFILLFPPWPFGQSPKNITWEKFQWRRDCKFPSRCFPISAKKSFGRTHCSLTLRDGEICRLVNPINSASSPSVTATGSVLVSNWLFWRQKSL